MEYCPARNQQWWQLGEGKLQFVTEKSKLQRHAQEALAQTDRGRQRYLYSYF
jgi:hypothetical protein